MLEKLGNALHANDNILFYHEDFYKVTFIANERNILAVDLNKINLDNDNDFDEDDPNTHNNIHVKVLPWHSKFKNRKALKIKMISKDLTSIEWHTKRWRSFCMSEDEKKEIEPIFTE